VNADFWRGVREGVPFAVAGGLLSISFGVLAHDTGLGAVGAIVMSAVVFGGSAQFASVGIYSTGGGLGTALLAATLVNSRFLPMGVALAPYLPGGPLKRALQGQPLVDPSWILARETDGAFNRHVMFGASAAQYVTWVSGTALGAFVGTGDIDPDSLGVDSIFPAFFLVLLLDELRRPGMRSVALGGALMAVVLVPLTPIGVPVVVASLAALVGLWREPPETAPASKEQA
jgi:4-azaleucine resistance transporter AzlC